MAIETDWKIGRAQDSCADCGSEFEPDTECVHALVDGEEGFERRSFHIACWSGVERGDCYSYWKSRTPPAAEEQRRLDYEMLFEFFKRLSDETDEAKRRLAYLVSLVLMRKRLLKFENSFAEGGESFMIVSSKNLLENARLKTYTLSPEESDEMRARLESLFAGKLDA